MNAATRRIRRAITELFVLAVTFVIVVAIGLLWAADSVSYALYVEPSGGESR